MILADSDTGFGGGLRCRPARIGEADGMEWARDAVAALGAMPEVRLLPETTVLGYYDDNYLIAAERVGERLGPAAPAGLPRQRLWHIRARRVVLATGAIERPLVFPDNDRPGIMLAGAVETYLHRYAVAAGRRAVLFVNNDGAYPLAASLARAGVAVAAIVDPRPEPGAAARRLADGIPLYSGHAVIGTAGRGALRRVRVRPSAAAADGAGAERDARLRSARRIGRLEPECAAFRANARPAALRPRSRGAGAGRERRGGGLRRGGERDFLARRLSRRGGRGGGAGRRPVRLRRRRAPGAATLPPAPAERRRTRPPPRRRSRARCPPVSGGAPLSICTTT